MVPPEARTKHKHVEGGCVDNWKIYELYEREFGLEYTEAGELYRALVSERHLREHYKTQISIVGVVIDFIISFTGVGWHHWTDENYQCTYYPAWLADPADQRSSAAAIIDTATPLVSSPDSGLTAPPLADIEQRWFLAIFGLVVFVAIVFAVLVGL